MARALRKAYFLGDIIAVVELVGGVVVKLLALIIRQIKSAPQKLYNSIVYNASLTELSGSHSNYGSNIFCSLKAGSRGMVREILSRIRFL